MVDKTGDTMRSLKDNIHGMIDLGVVLMIGIAFVGMMVVAYIIWTIRDNLVVYEVGSTPGSWTAAENSSHATKLSSIANVTGGFDSAVNLLLIAITIFILAIAISALLMLRGR